MLLRIVDWVSQSAYEIESMWDDWLFLWGQYETQTIINTPDYSGPNDLSSWDLESATIDGARLVNTDYRVFRDSIQSAGEAGIPSVVTLLPSNALRLYPTPDSAAYTLNIDYWKAPVKMINPTDTSPIPERYERIIVARAKMSYAGEEGAAVMLESAANEYSFLLSRLQMDQLRGQRNRLRAEADVMVVRAI